MNYTMRIVSRSLCLMPVESRDPDNLAIDRNNFVTKVNVLILDAMGWVGDRLCSVGEGF